VSTNLTRNRMHVHRTGPIWHAVRSSGAIPGALPPFVDEAGDMFVDGALVDNLPVASMRELKLGPNVIAGFFEDESRSAPLRYDSVPSRERLIGDIVMRRQRKFPGLVNVLSRSMLVTSRRSLRETEIGSDFLVRLPAKTGMGILDWKFGRAQEELCYRHVCELIEAAGGPEGLIADMSAAGPSGSA
jgi:NTE family protein